MDKLNVSFKCMPTCINCRSYDIFIVKRKHDLKLFAACGNCLRTHQDEILAKLDKPEDVEFGEAVNLYSSTM